MDRTFSFEGKELDKFEEICKLYIRTKGWILYAEEQDPDFKSFLQPSNELKNAFDHLMRVFVVKVGITEVTDEEEYIEKNLEKALGHVFRGAFDTLDQMAITFRERITLEISPFSPEVINDLLPEYYPKIRGDIENINNKISEIRAHKDVASICYGDIKEYSDIIERLKEYYDRVIRTKPNLIEYEEKLKLGNLREKIASEISRFSVDSITAVIPEYYSHIRPDMDKINKQIEEIKTKRSDNSMDQEDIKEYLNLSEKLNKYYSLILEKKPSLIEYEENSDKRERQRKYFELFLVLLGVLLGAAITILL